MAMAARGDHVAVLLGILVATAVSFAIASVILRSAKDTGNEDLEEAATKMQAMKGKKSSVAGNFTSQNEGEEETAAEKGAEELSAGKINKIIFACDAGMGSSAMGASILKNKVKKAGLDIEVTNKAINQIPDDADLIITHKDLTDRAKAKQPDKQHISVDNFMNSAKYDEIVNELKDSQ
jgi:mannitol PTS system EIICBA or EIICB component